MVEDFYNLLLVEGLAELTVDGYRRVLSKFFRETGTTKPKRKDVESYVAALRKGEYSYSHIANTSVAIERYMAFIKRPVKLGRPRKPKNIIKTVLTEGEVARILAAAKNERERAIIALLAYSGIRCKELCSLRVSDLDLDNLRLRIICGKGSRDRVVYLSRECARILTEYISRFGPSGSELLFTTLQGRPYNGWALRKLVKTVAARAGIKKRVYPHLFRHSLACNLLNRGANIMTIQALLGHQDIRTTLIYAHSTPQRVQQEYNFYCPAYL